MLDALLLGVPFLDITDGLSLVCVIKQYGPTIGDICIIRLEELFGTAQSQAAIFLFLSKRPRLSMGNIMAILLVSAHSTCEWEPCAICLSPNPFVNAPPWAESKFRRFIC